MNKRNKALLRVLHHPLQPGVGGNAGHSASFGDGFAFYFVKVGGEINGSGIADIAARLFMNLTKFSVWQFARRLNKVGKEASVCREWRHLTPLGVLAIELI